MKSQPHRPKDKEKPRINKPSVDLEESPVTIDELDKDLRDRIHVIRQEFINGLHFVRNHQERSVTVFGSARLHEDHPYYQKAREVAKRIADEGIDVVTGGGPGVMEAANRGALESDGEGHSLGLNIELPHEQVLNEYVEDNEQFYYFFSRKVALTFSAETYLFFPGGYGTLDEFMEILTLVQTKKIVSVPIVLVGKEFWGGVDAFFKNTLRDEYETISSEDIDLYIISDDVDEIVEICKEAPLREE